MLTYIIFAFEQVRNMKTLGEALEVFTKEEVVSFKWDKEVNADTGALNDHTPKTSGAFYLYRVYIRTYGVVCVYLFVWPHRGFYLYHTACTCGVVCLSVWPHCVVLVLFFCLSTTYGEYHLVDVGVFGRRICK